MTGVPADLFDVLPDPLMVLDDSRRIVEVDQAATRLDLPRLFTKFYRRSGGRPIASGLGLWINRGIVASHGGELVAESKLGSGSTFRFTLPLIDLDKLQHS
jgi:signal transduction histidine kinase